ncbi:MAG: hypothetical protein RLZ51_1857 [Pseudomonadota bacterium]|jgi:hypothetical protein
MGKGEMIKGGVKLGVDVAEDILRRIMGNNGGPAMDTIDLPAGSRPEYRGAAPNRTTEYPRYTPKVNTDRMSRLIAAADDPNAPIQSVFDSYIEKGKTLSGSDWYNSEELRDWMIAAANGDEARGDAMWRDYVNMVGATSTGSDVPSNLRNASFYYTLPPEMRRAVAERVSQGGITPGAAARELGVSVPNMPDDYNYGHVMQGNHAKNVLNIMDGNWSETPPAGLTKGELSAWLKANPKVKGFRNDLLGSEQNIAADKHFMRLLAMSDGGTDFLTQQAQLSGANLEKLRAAYGDVIEPYIKTRKTGTGQLVTEVNLYKAAQDGVIQDTALFRDVPQAWLDVPNDNEYAALEEMAQRLAARYEMTPAQFQANLWMGAGDLTGLADESQGTFMELMRRTIDKRAGQRITDRRSQFMDFAQGRSPLAVTGAGLGGGLLSMQPDQAQAATMSPEDEMIQYLKSLEAR